MPLPLIGDRDARLRRAAGFGGAVRTDNPLAILLRFDMLFVVGGAVRTVATPLVILLRPKDLAPTDIEPPN